MIVSIILYSPNPWHICNISINLTLPNDLYKKYDISAKFCASTYSHCDVNLEIFSSCQAELVLPETNISLSESIPSPAVLLVNGKVTNIHKKPLGNSQRAYLMLKPAL